jgi:hypothetical protein
MNKQYEALNTKARSVIDEIVAEYKKRIVDSVIEDAIIKKVNIEEISSRDVLNTEQRIENDKERIKKNINVKKNVVNYMVLIMLFAINLTNLTYGFMVQTNDGNEYIMPVLVLMSTVLNLVLIVNVLIEMGKQYRTKNK